MLNNVLAYPEIYSIHKISKCSVCNSEYTTNLYHNSWGLLTIITPILCFFQKYWFSVLLICFSLLFISGVIVVSLLLNFIFFMTIFVAFCYWRKLRPRFFATFDGIRLGFIRIGDPVPGLGPGVLIAASSNMNDGVFINSKILITAYDINLGAVGYIINKKIGKNYSELQDQTGYFIGGPVSPNSRHVMHNNPLIPDTKQVIENIYIGGQVFHLTSHDKSAVFLGYCG